MTSSYSTSFWSATSAAAANAAAATNSAIRNVKIFNNTKLINNNCENKFEEWSKITLEAKLRGDAKERSYRAKPPSKLLETNNYEFLQHPYMDCPASGSSSPGVLSNGLIKCSSNQISPNLLVPRPLRRCRSASPAATLKAPLLTIEQQNLIKKSWQKVSKSVIGKTIYIHMTEKCADSKNLFLNDFSSIGRHERYFVDLLQSTVDNLTDMEIALRPWLETIGEGHTGFAIKQVHWDAFGEAILHAISAWIGRGKMQRETIRAWRLLVSFIADRLGSAPLFRNGTRSTICSTPRIQLLTLVSNCPKTPP